jgi:hypothetical protein
MEYHDPKSTSVDELLSLLTEFEEQQEKIQRLDAYYNQTISEIRASLDGSQEFDRSQEEAVST